MENPIRKQAETLFRLGNPRTSGGSAGTAWARLLDILIEGLEDDERLVHIAGWEWVVSHLGKTNPALLTVTSKRLILQEYPVGAIAPFSLENLDRAESRGPRLPGQSALVQRLKDGSEIKIYMPRDVAAPLAQAITAVLAGDVRAVLSKPEDQPRRHGEHAAPAKSQGTTKPTRAELEDLYQQDNNEQWNFGPEMTNLARRGAALARDRKDLRKDATQLLKEGGALISKGEFKGNFLEGAEGMYLDRLERVLDDDESVSALISFDEEIGAIANFLQKKSQNRYSLLAVTSKRVIQVAGSTRSGWDGSQPKDLPGGADDLVVVHVPYEDIAGITARRVLLSVGADRALHLHLKSGSFFKIEGMSGGRSKLAEERIREALILH